MKRRPCPRHPDRASLGVACRHSLRRNEQLAFRAPGGKAAFKRLGRNAVMPHPGADALAELQSFLADNDDRLALEARCRAHERFGVAVLSARN